MSELKISFDDKKTKSTPNGTAVKKAVAQMQCVEPKEPSVIQKPLFVYKYHTRVTKWWSQDPAVDPFTSDPRYQGYAQETQKRVRLEHAFALAVDTYAKSEGLGDTGQQITLIGELEMPDGKLRRGLFVYVFDEQGVCYHRQFTEKTGSELYIQLLEKGCYQLDFPPLSPIESKNPLTTALYHDGSYVESETEELITIKNQVDTTTIRLCRFS
jgi:hypothetical protein